MFKMLIKLRNVFFIILIFNCQFLWSQNQIDSNKIIKVLTYNIFHGATMKGDFNLDLISSVINDANPDLVALQEVDFKTNRAKKYDLATELGWRCKMASVFAKAMNFDHGEYGDAILSKYSFLQTRRIALPYTNGNEPRTAVEIIVILPSGDTIAFISTHLDHLKDESDRIAQAKKLNEIFVPSKYPCILAGDFNAQPGSIPINILEEEWAATYDMKNIEPTFPSDNPLIKIDYVMFLPKNRWRTLKTKVISNEISSDHCAYMVTLELLPK